MYKNEKLYKINLILLVLISFYLSAQVKQGHTNKNKFLLNNINLEIEFPASVSITGDSGCGKTTFVDLLTTLLVKI